MAFFERPVPLPGEHGAWAIFYGSFWMGSVAAEKINPAWVLILVSMTGLFLAHGPLTKLIRSSSRVAVETRAHWIRWISFYMAVFMAPALALVFIVGRMLLLPLGLAVALVMGIHLYWASRRRERALSGEILGILALSSAALATHYSVTGNLTSTSAEIWLLAVLYYSSGVFYVRMRVSRFLKKDLFRVRRSICLAYHIILEITLIAFAFEGSFPALIPLAYLPIFVRAFWYAWKAEERLNIKRIGYTEVGQTVLFLILFSVFWVQSHG